MARQPHVDDRVVADTLEKLRELCLDLPDATERASHASPTFFIRDKRSFVMFHDDHHGDGRLAIWCAAPPGVQELVVEQDGDRFFRPPYVGHRGWIGLRLDVDVDWGEVEGVVRDAYCEVAPKTVVAALPRPLRGSR